MTYDTWRPESTWAIVASILSGIIAASDLESHDDTYIESHETRKVNQCRFEVGYQQQNIIRDDLNMFINSDEWKDFCNYSKHRKRKGKSKSISKVKSTSYDKKHKP